MIAKSKALEAELDRLRAESRECNESSARTIMALKAERDTLITKSKDLRDKFLYFTIAVIFTFIAMTYIA